MDSRITELILTVIITLLGSKSLPFIVKKFFGNGNNVLSKDIYTLWRDAQLRMREMQKEIDDYREKYYRLLRKASLAKLDLDIDERGELDLGPPSRPIEVD